MMSANIRIRFGLQIVFVCLYITYANLIWRHWTYKMPVRYNLSSVWVRLSIFSQLSIIQYGGLCFFFQFTHFLRDDWENIYTLSYHHHQIRSTNYYPLFRVRLSNNGTRCMSFYILIIYSEYGLAAEAMMASYGDTYTAWPQWVRYGYIEYPHKPPKWFQFLSRVAICMNEVHIWKLIYPFNYPHVYLLSV